MRRLYSEPITHGRPDNLLFAASKNQPWKRPAVLARARALICLHEGRIHESTHTWTCVHGSVRTWICISVLGRARMEYGIAVAPACQPRLDNTECTTAVLMLMTDSRAGTETDTESQAIAKHQVWLRVLEYKREIDEWSAHHRYTVAPECCARSRIIVIAIVR